MQYFPNAPTCPPLQVYEWASTGFELWPPHERGLRNQRTESQAKNARDAAVAPEPANLTRLSNQRMSGRGGILSLFIYGGG